MKRLRLPRGYDVEDSASEACRTLYQPNGGVVRRFSTNASPGDIERAAWSHWRRVDDKARELAVLFAERRRRESREKESYED